MKYDAVVGVCVFSAHEVRGYFFHDSLMAERRLLAPVNQLLTFAAARE